jgi:N-acetylmuramoyl-L-alanine amidase
MKKLLLIFIAGLIIAFPLFAEEKKELALRYSQHDNIIRVVLQSDDDFIKNANIIATLSSIKMEFPAIFDLRKLKDFPFDTTIRDRYLLITLKNVEDLKSYKLTSPARIVIELKLVQKAVKELPLPAEKQSVPVEKKVEPTEKKAAPTEKKAEQKQEQKNGQEQPAAKPAAPKIIFLDAGHGGYDYGIISKDAKEKDIDLLLAKDLNAAIAKKGDKVFLTRKVDQSLSLYDRIIVANSRKPDIFISIHSSASNAFAVYTATTDDPATEASVKMYGLAAKQGRHIEKSRALAKAIGGFLKDTFKGDLFARELPLPVLNSMDATAVLIEYPSLQVNSYDQKMRDLLVNAVVKGLRSYE